MTTYDRPTTDQNHTPTEVPAALLAARAGEFDRDMRAREARARRNAALLEATPGPGGPDAIAAWQDTVRGVGDPARGGTA